ncbi:hypothetical protein GC177_10735 [bacterium]|nr:hypothetical protein [bacterium]
MGLSLPEILVVAVVALMVIGPEDLPRVMRSFGRMVGKIKRHAESWMEEGDAPLKPTKPVIEQSHVVVGDDGKPYEAYTVADSTSKKNEATPR